VPVLCLGEAIVDLVCERPAASLADADAFAPRFGGAVANVAVVAARNGARTALAGGAGDDAWGVWLRDRLAAEGVATDWFRLVPGARTPVAFVTVDATGEPDFQVYGDGIAPTVLSVAPDLARAIEQSDALFFASNTLVGADERELTMRARELALDAGLPVIFDPNLRMGRWRERSAAAAAARACVPEAFLVKLNQAEAELLTGEPDPERAADALVAMGARLVVVTRGAGGALLRGELRADADGVPATALSAVGAGDAVAGVLLARLAQTGFYPAAAAAALPAAMAAGARATEHWGALA